MLCCFSLRMSIISCDMRSVFQTWVRTLHLIIDVQHQRLSFEVSHVDCISILFFLGHSTLKMWLLFIDCQCSFHMRIKGTANPPLINCKQGSKTYTPFHLGTHFILNASPITFIPHINQNISIFGFGFV